MILRAVPARHLLPVALSEQRLNPNLLEFTYLSDKINILSGLKSVTNAEAKKLGGLNELRNQVAHNRNYVADLNGLHKFLERMRRTRTFVDEFERRAVSPM